jgi:hypothetical protein
MQKNYKPWDINIESFSGLSDLLHFAVLAPSSHNSQPWQFHISGECITVSLEPKRLLPESDTNDRQAIISLGCAVKNIEIAAAYYGYSSEVVFDELTHTAQICIKKEEGQLDNSNHMALFISKRFTNRSPHSEKALNAEAISSIKGLENHEFLQIDIVTNPEQVKKLGSAAVTAGIDAMNDKGFRNELSDYLKSNLTRSPVGMPGFGLGFPLPISILAPTLVRMTNMGKASEKQDRSLFDSTQAIIVISTKSDSRADWFEVGRIYEEIALIATRSGMATSPWGAPIQIGEHYKRIQSIIDTNHRPQLFCRLGYPTKSVAHSPRLSAEEVTI